MYSFPSWMGLATIASFIMLAAGNVWAFWKTLKKIKDIEGCCNGSAASASQAVAALAALAKLKQGLEAAKTIDEAKEYLEKHMSPDEVGGRVSVDQVPSHDGPDQKTTAQG